MAYTLRDKDDTYPDTHPSGDAPPSTGFGPWPLPCQFQVIITRDKLARPLSLKLFLRKSLKYYLELEGAIVTTILDYGVGYVMCRSLIYL